MAAGSWPAGGSSNVTIDLLSSEDEGQPPRKAARTSGGAEPDPGSFRQASALDGGGGYAGPIFLNRLLSVEASSAAEVTLQDIFEESPSALPLQEALVVNFMIDLAWLLDECPALMMVPLLTVLHGDNARGCGEAVAMRKSRGLETRLHSPPLPLQWGTHHSKFVLLMYPDCIRVCVRTNNDLFTDFHCKSQALFLQDFPAQQAPAAADAFGADFAGHLRLYMEKSGGFDASKLAKYDFSTAAVALVGSVPGYHLGRESEHWGHMRLRRLLAEHSRPLASPEELLCQFSSLGSLSEKYLHQEFAATLSACRPRSAGARLPLNLVVPTMSQVRDCGEGWVAGASVPIRKGNLKDWLAPLWRRWGARDERTSAGRRAAWAMPHVKSYCRFTRGSPDSGQGPQLAWLFVGSQNLSKAAWGEVQKGGTQLCVRSYELGALVLPSRLQHLEPDRDRRGRFWRHRAPAAEVPAVLTPLGTGQAAGMDASPQLIQVACPACLPPAAPPAPDDPPWAVDREDAAAFGLDRFGTRAGERAREFYGHRAAKRG